MFEDLTEPDVKDLQKQIKDLEQEKYDLELENLSQRARMSKDWNVIEQNIRAIKKCRDKFGEDKIDSIFKEVYKDLKNKPDVTINDIEED